MEKILTPDHFDLIREAFIVLTGLIIRWFELRRIKNKEQNED